MSRPSDTRVAEYGEIPIANVWHMLLYAWGHVTQIERWRAAADAAPTLQALLAHVLVMLLRQRLRIGLGREYMPVENVLRGVRGRILLTRSLRERRFERGQAACAYTSYEFDAPRNQIIKSVLERLIRIGDLGTGEDAARLRGNMRRLTRDLHMVSTVEVTPDLIRRQSLGRNDGDYRLMLSICELILVRLLPTDGEGLRPLPHWAHDQRDLQRLFEAFVPNFLKVHTHDWNIATQVRWTWPATGGRLPQMIPDLVLDHHHHECRIVLDTKFSKDALSSAYGGKATLSSANLYQLYSYLRTQEDRSQRARRATGVLVYPETHARLREAFDVQGHHVVVASIDLAQHWQDVEDEFLDLFDRVAVRTIREGASSRSTAEAE